MWETFYALQKNVLWLEAPKLHNNQKFMLGSKTKTKKKTKQTSDFFPFVLVDFCFYFSFFLTFLMSTYIFDYCIILGSSSQLMMNVKTHDFMRVFALARHNDTADWMSASVVLEYLLCFLVACALKKIDLTWCLQCQDSHNEISNLLKITSFSFNWSKRSFPFPPWKLQFSATWLSMTLHKIDRTTWPRLAPPMSFSAEIWKNIYNAQWYFDITLSPPVLENYPFCSWLRQNKIESHFFWLVGRLNSRLNGVDSLG